MPRTFNWRWRKAMICPSGLSAVTSRQEGKSRLFRALAVAIPMLLHGVYDYIAAARIQDLGWVFLPFIGCMFVASWLLVKMMAKRDGYIQ